MDGDRGNVELTSERPLVQRLDIFESTFEPVSAQVDFIPGHRVKHERVIWVWRVPKGKDVGLVIRHFFRFRFHSERDLLDGQIKLRTSCDERAEELWRTRLGTLNDHPLIPRKAKARGVRLSIKKTKQPRISSGLLVTSLKMSGK